MILSRSWLLLTLPVAVLALGLLTRVAIGLVRTTRSAVVASVPVRTEQRIAFDRAGELVARNRRRRRGARARTSLGRRGGEP